MGFDNDGTPIYGQKLPPCRADVCGAAPADEEGPFISTEFQII
jgi:hypothetical protein